MWVKRGRIRRAVIRTMKESPQLAGLTQAEADARLAREGYNELPAAKPRGLLVIALEVVREPMFLLLVACGAIYLVLGDVREALVLLAFVLVVIGHHALSGAEDRARARSAARPVEPARAGHPRRRARSASPAATSCATTSCPARRRPRSGRRASLFCDESVRRRIAADRRVGAGPKDAAADELRRARRAATICRSSTPARWSSRGRASRAVAATGAQTELGKIGKALAVDRAGANAAAARDRSAGAAARGRSALLSVRAGRRRLRPHARRLARRRPRRLTLAMAMLPEEFPVVLTVFLALGAWRISRQRRADAPHAGDRDARLRHRPVRRQDRHADAESDVGRETRGGRRAVRCRLATDSARCRSGCHEVVEFGILASQPRPVRPDGEGLRRPRRASLARTTSTCRQRLDARARYPLSTALLAHVARLEERRPVTSYVVATKGAPEAIADLCRLERERTSSLQPQIAAHGRTTACACSASRARAFRGGALAGLAARISRSSPRPRRPRRSGAADSARRGARMPVGRHPRRHDHRRLPGDRARDRAPGRPRRPTERDHRRRTRAR